MSIPMHILPQDTSFSYLHNDDEIDLRELFATLWEGKIFIIAIASILTVGGLAYALLASQEWSAKAIVVEASPIEVEQLRQKLERMVTTTTTTTLIFLLYSQRKSCSQASFKLLIRLITRQVFLKKMVIYPP